MTPDRPGARPPRALRWLAARALPRDEHEHVLGDMEEVWGERRARRGAGPAGAWYARQVLGLWLRFLPARAIDFIGSFGLSWLDLKLGLRMLVKHPGLSLASGAALAVAIAFGAGLYEFFGEFVDIDLPFDEGDRIVRITNWDARAGQGVPRSAADFAHWREEVRTVESLTAMERMEAAVSEGEAPRTHHAAARVTASMFDLVRVPPLLGRPLLPGDEEPGAPPVAVVSYALWRGPLLGRSDVVGSPLRIDGVEHTVVGVMPEGFAFPLGERLWVPLSLPAGVRQPAEGPALLTMGRLTAGVGFGQAQAELSAVGRRAAERWPGTHAGLDPRVAPTFHTPGGDWQRWVALGVQSAFALLLAIAALDVAILSFSRTASRQGEIAVRTALGAGRRRIVTQLVAEALALSACAAVAGLAFAALVLPRASGLFWAAQDMEVPYWVDPGLAPGTIAYAFLLALLGAAIAGAVPALKVTGRGMGEGLRNVRLGGSALRFGLLPTVVIVIQVAASVAFLPYPVMEAVAIARSSDLHDVLPMDRILAGRLVWEDGPAASDEQGDRTAAVETRSQLLEALRARLAREPGVLGVTFATRLPAAGHPWSRFELDGGRPPAVAEPGTRRSSVAPGWVEGLGIRLLSGRTLGAADLDAGASAVLVNEAFVERYLGGDALGRRIRLVQPPAGDGTEGRGPWMEIVGVVQNLPINLGDPGAHRPWEAIYVPAPPGAMRPAHVAVRLSGPATAFAGTLRRAVADTDPEIRLDRVMPLSEVERENRASRNLILLLSVLLAALVTGLAVGGVYTLMSFLVQQRFREIGVRTALGAAPARLVRDIFARAAWQLAVGVALGLTLLAVAIRKADGEVVAVALGGAAVVVMTGLAACAIPTRRALRIEPTDALRAE